MAKVKSKKITIEEALVPVEEQPYQIPDNWCWVYQNVVCQLSDGEKKSGEEYPYLEVKYLRGNVEADIKESGKYITANSKIILVDGENSGEVFEVIEDGYMGSTFKVLNIAEGIDEKYLLYFVDSKREILRNSKTGSAIPHLNKKLFFSMEFPLPPLAEQKRIVEQIENLFSKLDEVKEKTQEALGSVEGRKTAILLNALDGKYTDPWRKENNVDISSWEKKTIDDISDVKGGKRVPKGMSLVSENTGHPYIKAGNLKKGTVIDDGIQYVPDDVLVYIKNYKVKAGDVYITNVGACIGDCGVIPEKYDGANLTENAVKMTNLKNCESKFLAYYLASNHVQQIIKGLIASATLGKLSIANIKSIEIRMPSLPEQIEIVNTIDALWKREELVQESVEMVLEKIELLKKAILAKAFRGELGTNIETEESALELLKSILK